MLSTKTSPAGCESRQPECAKGKQIGDDAALHVAGAAAVKASVDNVPTKRGVAPGRRIADFDRVDVPVQNQGASASLTSTDSHDIRAAGEIRRRG